MNANLIFKWLRDPRFAPEPEPEVADAPCFLPVEIVDRVACEEEQLVDGGPTADGTIEIDITDGHRLRIVGTYDPEALARLIRGLSG